MRILLIVLGCACSLVASAQTKHPFTFEDMMKLKRIEEPVLSPDGKWILFAAVDVDLVADTKTAHIWVVPTAGGPEKEIIGDQDADRPRWAPDGERFAFISTKEGGSQVWIADFDGVAGSVTGAHRLTSIATGAGGELWSPDGNNILFTSDVYPECGNEICNAKKLAEAKNPKVGAQIFTHLLYRHWGAFKEGKRTHLLIVAAEGGAARDLTPGDFDSPPFSLGGQDDYAFSPHGQELCYTSNHDPMEATSTNKDLWIVPVTGGTAKNITAENKASDSTPLYSPDGKYIAYRAQARPGYESDRFRLRLYDRKTEDKKDLTEDFDRWVGTFSWSRDSSTLYFSSEEAGGMPVFRFRLAEAGPIPVVNGFNDGISINPDGKRLFFTRMSWSRPNEIFQADLAGSSRELPPSSHAECTSSPVSQPVCVALKPLTHLNDEILSQVSMSSLESFWFTGSLGDKVQGFLVKPPNFDPDKKYPVKFLIHGGPQGAWGDDWSYRWNPELFAANGYVVIMINFHGSTGYGQRFVDAINGDWGGAPFEDLMKGLDYAEQHFPFIDKDRECAMGASYGGYMTNWILGHTDRFKCIVTHDGTFNTESFWGTTEELWFPEWEFKGTPYNNRELYRKWSPHLFANNFKTPTLVIHSQKDFRLDVSEGLQLFTTLQRMGVPSKLLYFPEEGHWILKPQNSQLWYKTVNDWVDQWIGKK